MDIWISSIARAPRASKGQGQEHKGLKSPLNALGVIAVSIGLLVGCSVSGPADPGAQVAANRIADEISDIAKLVQTKKHAFDALLKPARLNGRNQALTAIRELVHREQTLHRGGSGYEIKRLVLRMLQRSGLYSAYGRARVRQRIARAAPRHAQGS